LDTLLFFSKNKEIIEELIIKLGEHNTILFVSHDINQINRISHHQYECKNKALIYGAPF